MNRARLTKEKFGTLANGESVEAITLVNANGMSVTIITYGASIQAVCVADRDGRFADVTTGYATLDEYVVQPQYFGATVGRVANRVAAARFELDGQEYRLPANDGRNSLHGGTTGFDKVNWTVIGCDEAGPSVSLQYISPDGDQGYPGTLKTIATYSLGADNTLAVHYRATTDAPTPVNLSNHAYWNLGGEGTSPGAMDHLLTINADHFLPVNAELIPTGERRPVENSAFDFREAKAIRLHIGDTSDAQIAFGSGYDHNWIVADVVADRLRPMAVLEDPRSGRTMALLSNQPGLQFYSGNLFGGSIYGKSGKFYQRGDAIALEPQQFPDVPNQPSFGSIILLPGQKYSSIVIWRFGTSTTAERS